MINKTRIIADPLANAIIVIGPKENQDKVDLLLDKLDRKSPQVYLATVIGQLTLSDGMQMGVDYLQKFVSTGSNSGLSSAFIAGREEIITNNNVADMRDNLITTALANAKGFNIYGQLGQSLDVFVSALETTNNFKVLSRPSVFALNNKRAVITSGQSIPVPESSLANASSNNNGTGNVTTTITYKDVVLKLEVIPLINPDGDVTLRVAQVNDTVVGNQIVAQNNVPIIGTEQIATTVTVPTGNTVVLGGLITETDKKDTEGIPVLSRIPGLGRLFREDVTSKERKELVIFIQPMVVNDDAHCSAPASAKTFAPRWARMPTRSSLIALYPRPPSWIPSLQETTSANGLISTASQRSSNAGACPPFSFQTPLVAKPAGLLVFEDSQDLHRAFTSNSSFPAGDIWAGAYGATRLWAA